jgi:hypothetical protein
LRREISAVRIREDLPICHGFLREDAIVRLMLVHPRLQQLPRGFRTGFHTPAPEVERASLETAVPEDAGGSEKGHRDRGDQYSKMCCGRSEALPHRSF